MMFNAKPWKRGNRKDIMNFAGSRFLVYAVLLSLLFSMIHVLGFREYTGVISGTADSGAVVQFMGALYILLYLCFAAIVPVLVIAGFLRIAARKVIKL
jgi:hypothetical protein